MSTKKADEEFGQRINNTGKNAREHKGLFGRFFSVLLVIVFLIFGGSAVKVTAMDDPADEKRTVTPSDVFSAVQKANQDLDLLRRHMGEPEAIPLDIRVYKAAPPDVYFQALTMFQKANRLSFEITRLQKQPPSLPEGDILPAHVMVLVKGAHSAIRKVMADLKIPESRSKSTSDPSKTPSDVFKTIMSTNRQLNLLLERRFAPSDVYIATTLAIGYAARLLSQYPSSMRIPDAPPLEREKKPADVYFRLLDCLEIISHIYKTAGLEGLDIDTINIDKKVITPSDVFDVASLIVARLDFLHKKFGLKKKPRETFYPGRKYPSDVYQYVGILEAQLKQIERFIAKRGYPNKQ